MVGLTFQHSTVDLEVDDLNTHLKVLDDVCKAKEQPSARTSFIFIIIMTSGGAHLWWTSYQQWLFCLTTEGQPIPMLT